MPSNTEVLRGRLCPPDSDAVRHIPERAYRSLERFVTGELVPAILDDGSACARCNRDGRPCEVGITPSDEYGIYRRAGDCVRCRRHGRECSIWKQPFVEAKPWRHWADEGGAAVGRTGFAPPPSSPHAQAENGGLEAEALSLLESVFERDPGRRSRDGDASERPIGPGFSPGPRRGAIGPQRPPPSATSVRYGPYQRPKPSVGASSGGMGAGMRGIHPDRLLMWQQGDSHARGSPTPPPPPPPPRGRPAEELLRHAETIREQGMRFQSWTLVNEADFLVKFAKDLEDMLRDQQPSFGTEAWSPWDTSAAGPSNRFMTSGRTRSLVPEPSSDRLGSWRHEEFDADDEDDETPSRVTVVTGDKWGPEQSGSNLVGPREGRWTKWPMPLPSQVKEKPGTDGTPQNKHVAKAGGNVNGGGNTDANPNGKTNGRASGSGLANGQGNGSGNGNGNSKGNNTNYRTKKGNNNGNKNDNNTNSAKHPSSNKQPSKAKEPAPALPTRLGPFVQPAELANLPNRPEHTMSNPPAGAHPAQLSKKQAKKQARKMRSSANPAANNAAKASASTASAAEAAGASVREANTEKIRARLDAERVKQMDRRLANGHTKGTVEPSAVPAPSVSLDTSHTSLSPHRPTSRPEWWGSQANAASAAYSGMYESPATRSLNQAGPSAEPAATVPNPPETPTKSVVVRVPPSTAERAALWHEMGNVVLKTGPAVLQTETGMPKPVYAGWDENAAPVAALEDGEVVEVGVAGA